MTDADTITLPLVLMAEVGESILVRPENAETSGVYLPNSQVTIGADRVGRRVSVTLPVWLAKARGLIVEPDPNQGRLF